MPPAPNRANATRDPPKPAEPAEASANAGTTNTSNEHFDFSLDDGVEDINFTEPPWEGLAQLVESEHGKGPSLDSLSNGSDGAHSLPFGTQPIVTFPYRTGRTLTFRSFMSQPLQPAASIIMNSLRAYPRTMMRRQAVPPFVHPTALVETEELYGEPLANCASLMVMAGAGGYNSRKLFWRNVQWECERFVHEVCIAWLLHVTRRLTDSKGSVMNGWQLLSALQATLMYLLMRLDEGETDFNNVDALLTNAVLVSLTEPALYR